MKGTDTYSLCRASVKRSCSENWEVTDQHISTGLDFLSRISTDFFKNSLLTFEAVL